MLRSLVGSEMCIRDSARADPRTTLTGQISSECVHCVGFRWPKTTIWGKFTFWGCYTAPFTDEGQIWCAIADSRYTFTCEISSRSVYCVVLWWGKTPVFAIFWTSAFSDVTNCHQSQKVEQGCTTTNLPLSNGIKIFSVLQRLHGEIGRTISDVQKRDEQTLKQTDKQTKKLNVFVATPAAGEIRDSPNLAR